MLSRKLFSLLFLMFLVGCGAKHTAGLMQSAEEAYFVGEYARAEELYRQAIKVSPNLPKAYRRLAAMASQRADYEHAVRLLTASLTLNPKSYQSAYALGLVHARQGEYRKAIPYFRKTLEINPRHLLAMEHLSNAYYRLGYLHDALAMNDIRIGVLASPSAQDYVARGALLIEMNRLEDAREAFLEVLDMAPEHAGAIVYLGYVEQRLGNLESSAKYYRKASLLRPNDHSIQQRLQQVESGLGVMQPKLNEAM